MRRSGAALAAVIALAGSPEAAPKPPAGCRPGPAIAVAELSAEAADRLRRAPGTTRLAADELRLRDGRLLVQGEAGQIGALYAPAAHALYRRERDETARLHRVAPGTSYHPLRGLIDDGATFPAQVKRLRGELGRRLAAAGEAAAGEAAAVERLLGGWRAARCRLDPALFRELTALLGELAITRAGGTWSTRAGSDGVSEPIVLRRDRRQPPFEPWRLVGPLLDEGGAIEPLLDAALAPPPAAPPTPAPCVGPGEIEPDGGVGDGAAGDATAGGG